MESYSAIRYEVDGAIARLTLDRPSVLNAINAQMRAELVDAVEAAGADRAVRVVLLRGAGERAFSAGADIGEFDKPESLVAERRRRHGPTWHEAIASCSKPVVAVIHGYCLGGGLEMALACDFRIAERSAVLGLPEVGLGLIPGAGGTQRLTRVIGQALALEMILTGERISGERAAEIGLVHQAVAMDELDDAAEEWCGRLATGAPLAVAAAKEAVRRGADMTIEDGLRLEADLATLLTATDDRAEGTRAFRDKRSPEFTGT